MIGRKNLNVQSKEQRILSSINKDDTDVNTVAKRFLKKMNRCVHQSFQKTRIRDHSDDNEITKLFDQRRLLRSKSDTESRSKLINVEEQLAKMCA